jgi:hypothetical protein
VTEGLVDGRQEGENRSHFPVQQPLACVHIHLVFVVFFLFVVLTMRLAQVVGTVYIIHLVDESNIDALGTKTVDSIERTVQSIAESHHVAWNAIARWVMDDG